MHHILIALHLTFNFLCIESTISNCTCLNSLDNDPNGPLTETTLAFYVIVTIFILIIEKLLRNRLQELQNLLCEQGISLYLYKRFFKFI